MCSAAASRADRSSGSATTRGFTCTDTHTLAHTHARARTHMRAHSCSRTRTHAHAQVPDVARRRRRQQHRPRHAVPSRPALQPRRPVVRPGATRRTRLRRRPAAPVVELGEPVEPGGAVVPPSPCTARSLTRARLGWPARSRPFGRPSFCYPAILWFAFGFGSRFGVADSQMQAVLPNRANFGPSQLIPRQALYR